MHILHAFTTGLKLDTHMLLDASTEGTMKIKKADEVRELIENMSLNEYRAHTEEDIAPKKKCIIDLHTQDDLLSSNELLIIQLETLAKRFDTREVAQLSTTMTHDFCEHAHERGLPANLGLS